jgi:hypothetical protein
MGGPSGGNSGSADAPNTTRSKVSVKSKAKIAAKNVVDFVKGGGVVGAVVRGIKEGAKKSKQNVLDYEGQAAGVTPMRSPMTTGRDGGDGGGAMGTSGQVVQAPQPMVAPTTAEVSQVTTTDAEDPLLLRKRKTLARGRSLTIQTGPTGATGSLTLGKPSLLGR